MRGKTKKTPRGARGQFGEREGKKMQSKRVLPCYLETIQWLILLSWRFASTAGLVASLRGRGEKEEEEGTEAIEKGRNSPIDCSSTTSLSSSSSERARGEAINRPMHQAFFALAPLSFSHAFPPFPNEIRPEAR